MSQIDVTRVLARRQIAADLIEIDSGTLSGAWHGGTCCAAAGRRDRG
jgi:hypothetical protein